MVIKLKLCKNSTSEKKCLKLIYYSKFRAHKDPSVRWSCYHLKNVCIRSIDTYFFSASTVRRSALIVSGCDRGGSQLQIAPSVCYVRPFLRWTVVVSLVYWTTVYSFGRSLKIKSSIEQLYAVKLCMALEKTAVETDSLDQLWLWSSRFSGDSA